MIRALRPLLAGFSVWYLAFVLLYAVQALGCRWGWPEATHRLLVVAIWLAALASAGVLLIVQLRRPDADRPARTIGLWGATLALAAVLATYFPVTFVSLCT